ncbi:AraC family transcriptional regulator [Sphingomonas abietis]|uniref:AraC family transcriptional regulator ligand-binding domain-containing protein n=1 Tax=Sphingomonas abietis TaxID=3012344 RepID=A0ABY7NRX8_9SPHN|nr:AraC family transcriptional regulator [Sphingomonas abietis]WBO23206.1 AraC family transcriptional regulator ligand-binding domain-containing protein [Sphingomonas abietis]
MRLSRFSAFPPVSVSHVVMEAVLDALASAKLLDQKGVAALRMRFASTGGAGRHSDRALISLWEAIVGMTPGDHGVGALLASRAGDTAWGVVGEVLRRTSTLIQAYTQMARYSRLVHQGLSITIEVSGNSAILRYQQARDCSRYPGSALAAGELWAMANLALIPRRWFDAALRPLSAELSCAAPASMGAVTEIFGPMVSFNSDRSTLVYDRRELERVQRQPEPRVLEFLSALAERELEELPPADDIRAVVAAELRGRLVGGAPTIDAVARSLGLSTRTLQRRLSEVGTTFAVILDDVRGRRAAQLIQSRTRSLGEITYMLGYSEQAALSRAVRRWFGVSPSKLALPPPERKLCQIS